MLRRKASLRVNQLGEEIRELDPSTVESHIENYNLLVDKRNTLATSIASNRLNIERADGSLFKEQIELEKLQCQSL